MKEESRRVIYDEDDEKQLEVPGDAGDSDLEEFDEPVSLDVPKVSKGHFE